MSPFRISGKFRFIFHANAISLVVCAFLWGCTIEHAQETVLAVHANGAKKTSIWVYPDGEILKRNEWYSDGIKELEIPYKDSVPHGEFKRWTGFGDLAMVGEYRHGKRSGTWTSYYTANLNSRKKEAVRHYKDDHPAGDWEGWFYNDNKSFEEHYSENGDSIGLWKKWNEDGSIAQETSCFRTTENGFFKKYNFKGILEQEYNCKQGNKDGEGVFYYDGKRVKTREHWSNGVLDGVREFFSGEGTVLKKEIWKSGVRDSIWQWFDTDGNKIAETILQAVQKPDMANLTQDLRKDYGTCGSRICAESTFVKNEDGDFALDGTLWFMKEGRTLRYQETWEKGSIVESRSFYPDTTSLDITYNKLASEGFWKDGKRNGIWRNWYRNGYLRDSLTYVDGERVGEQFSYDSTGKLTIHKTENGKNRPVIMHIPGID